ncbi:unnamed protein product [Cuscuta europaea]|uniref:DUF4216 domain-containing protein n=1 Tax=Cuscuta europaea TaxID=41803 RepID=A0A9P1EHD2_CUSEU|nr:unnamed protein product [Cuscuta europaea]
MYLRGVETRFNREDRNSDIASEDSLLIFSQRCRPFGATTYVELSQDELNATQWFVFQNCEELEPYFEKHKEELLFGGCENIDKEHKEKFPAWFKKHMHSLYKQEPSRANESLYSLACAPHRCVRKYSGCIVNGVRFLIKDRDTHRKSQNSGIVVEGNHGEEIINFYGVLTEIIQLDYVKDRHVTIFKCEWFDLGRKKAGIRKEGNITSIRITNKWYENDSYILADQARQVVYINDPKLGVDWRVVQPFQHRHIYDVPEQQNEEKNYDDSVVANEVYQENEIEEALEVTLDDIQSMHREDIDPDEIEETLILEQFEGPHTSSIEVDHEDEIDETLIDYLSSEDSIENTDSDFESDDNDWEI